VISTTAEQAIQEIQQLFHYHQPTPVAAEALKKWDGGRGQAPRWRQGYEEGAYLFPVMGSESRTPENFVKIYVQSVQHSAFWGKIRILNNSVFNLDFGRSI